MTIIDSFTATLSKSDVARCDDGFGINHKLRAYSVADGVSSSGGLSGYFAQTAADWFAGDPYHAIDWLKSLGRQTYVPPPGAVDLPRLWRENQQRLHFKNNASEKYDQAACTLGGLMLCPPSAASEQEFLGVVVGDSAIFFLYDEYWQGYNNDGELPQGQETIGDHTQQTNALGIDSDAGGLRASQPAHFFKHAPRADGVVILATDALAAWIHGKVAGAAHPREAVAPLLGVTNQSEFEVWVRQCRHEDGLKLDDVAMVRLEVSVAGETAVPEPPASGTPRDEAWFSSFSDEPVPSDCATEDAAGMVAVNDGGQLEAPDGPAHTWVESEVSADVEAAGGSPLEADAAGTAWIEPVVGPTPEQVGGDLLDPPVAYISDPAGSSVAPSTEVPPAVATVPSMEGTPERVLTPVAAPCPAQSEASLLNGVHPVGELIGKAAAQEGSPVGSKPDHSIPSLPVAPAEGCLAAPDGLEAAGDNNIDPPKGWWQSLSLTILGIIVALIVLNMAYVDYCLYHLMHPARDAGAAAVEMVGQTSAAVIPNPSPGDLSLRQNPPPDAASISNSPAASVSPDKKPAAHNAAPLHGGAFRPPMALTGYDPPGHPQENQSYAYEAMYMDLAPEQPTKIPLALPEMGKATPLTTPAEEPSKTGVDEETAQGGSTGTRNQQSAQRGTRRRSTGRSAASQPKPSTRAQTVKTSVPTTSTKKQSSPAPTPNTKKDKKTRSR